MTAPLLHELPPIIDDGAWVLILGNMGSVMSLAAGQYYANPRNAFWRITAADSRRRSGAANGVVIGCGVRVPVSIPVC